MRISDWSSDVCSSDLGSVRWLTLARPAAANALNQATCGALVNALQQAAQESAIGAVVLGAMGDRAFCAGADLKEFAELPKAEAAQRRRALLMDILYALLDFPKPLLACVQAPAVGAGGSDERRVGNKGG